MTTRRSLGVVVADPRGDFEVFLGLAGVLLASRTAPERVQWHDSTGGEESLFPSGVDGATARERDVERVRASLGELGPVVACHRDGRRWDLLYRIAHRVLVGGEATLLRDPVDPDTRGVELMAKAVRRDVHKMKAFVRFRRVSTDVEGGERYVAWHRPEHRILRLAAPFFAGRFNTMRWTIFTPVESVDHDAGRLTYGAGVPASAVRAEDDLERLWKTYYGSIFNPARIKIRAMVKEMPVRHWSTLPETSIIRDLLRSAPERVTRMIEAGVQERGAEAFVPKGDLSLPLLREAATACTGCPIGELGTHTVFGEGPSPAAVMLVGEQPGDEEDRVGRPFVGPAGQLLDRALAEAGLDRSQMYVTNAVKHFKFVPRGKRRIHQKPTAGEIRACSAWLDREIELVQPRSIVLLGATAGHALLGHGFRVLQSRGRWLTHPTFKGRLFATVHPSSVLRSPPELREAAYAEFVGDLRKFREQEEERH